MKKYWLFYSGTEELSQMAFDKSYQEVLSGFAAQDSKILSRENQLGISQQRDMMELQVE